MRPEGAVRVAQVGKQTVGREIWLQLHVWYFKAVEIIRNWQIQCRHVLKDNYVITTEKLEDKIIENPIIRCHVTLSWLIIINLAFTMQTESFLKP